MVTLERRYGPRRLLDDDNGNSALAASTARPHDTDGKFHNLSSVYSDTDRTQEAAVLWDELHLTLKRIRSSTAFKRHIRNYLLSLY